MWWMLFGGPLREEPPPIGGWVVLTGSEGVYLNYRWRVIGVPGRPVPWVAQIFMGHTDGSCGVGQESHNTPSEARVWVEQVVRLAVISDGPKPCGAGLPWPQPKGN